MEDDALHHVRSNAKSVARLKHTVLEHIDNVDASRYLQYIGSSTNTLEQYRPEVAAVAVFRYKLFPLWELPTRPTSQTSFWLLSSNHQPAVCNAVFTNHEVQCPDRISNLASTRQALFPVVQRTDHLCHFSVYVFLRGLSIANLRVQVVFMVSRVPSNLRKKNIAELKERKIGAIPRSHSPSEAWYPL